MSRRPTELMTVEQFLDWLDRKGDDGHLYELVGGRLVVCENGTPRHDSLTTRLAAALVNGMQARGGCEVYTRRSLRTDRSLRVPDLHVSCSPKAGRVDDDATFIVEVLSPSTGIFDLTDKLHEYMLLPSLRQYLCVDPRWSAPSGYLFTRTDIGWHTDAFVDVQPGEHLRFADVDLDLCAIFDALPPITAEDDEPPRG